MLLCSALGVLTLASVAYSQTIDLGTASAFGALAGSAITNSGETVVDGDIGVSPSRAISGFPPGRVTTGSEIYEAGAVPLQAQSDVTVAYNTAAGLQPTDDLTGQDLGGLRLTAGVYNYDAIAQLTGTLTLDAEGDNDAQFVFQIGSGLNTATDSSVSLVNGASFCNVFWQVGSSATLGTGTSFAGSILALTSISLGMGASELGGLYARNGAVTLLTNDVTSPQGCVDAVTSLPASSDTTATSTSATVIATVTATTSAGSGGGDGGGSGDGGGGDGGGNRGGDGGGDGGGGDGTTTGQVSFTTIITTNSSITRTRTAPMAPPTSRSLITTTITESETTRTGPSSVTSPGHITTTIDSLTTNSGSARTTPGKLISTPSIKTITTFPATAPFVKQSTNSQQSQVTTVSRFIITTNGYRCITSATTFTATCPYPTAITSYGYVFTVPTPCVAVLVCPSATWWVPASETTVASTVAWVPTCPQSVITAKATMNQISSAPPLGLTVDAAAENASSSSRVAVTLEVTTHKASSAPPFAGPKVLTTQTAVESLAPAVTGVVQTVPSNVPEVVGTGGTSKLHASTALAFIGLGIAFLLM